MKKKGLDATTANDVMEVLKLIAAKGVLVVVVLHQPRYEIFSQFDNVTLLAPGGKTVYNARTDRIMQYFDSMGYAKPELVNPADFILDVISGMVENRKGRRMDFARHWRRARSTGKYDLRVNAVFAAKKNNADYVPRSKLSALAQCKMCAARAVTIHVRQRSLIMTDVLLVALAGFVVGFVVDSTNLSLVASNIDFSIMGASVVGAIISLRVFGNDRTMYWRLSSAGINRLAYYVGSSLSCVPWIFAEPLIFLALWYPMAMPRAAFGHYYAVLVLGMLVVQGIGHVISVGVDPNKSILLSVVLVLIQNFTNGFQPTLTSMTGTVAGKAGTAV